MLLSDLLQTTATVSIKRGKATFNLEVALENFTPEGGYYQKILQDKSKRVLELNLERDEMSRRLAELVTQMNGLNLDLIRADLEEKAKEARTAEAEEAPTPREKKKIRQRSIVITDEQVQEEFESRLKALDAASEELHAQKEANTFALKREHARPLAYLVAGSDLTDKNGDPVLSGVVEKTPEQMDADIDVFAKFFSNTLIDHCLAKVEEAVFSPLGMTG